MGKYVLRVEGVNFTATMDDTQNLSCNRGASLALSHAVATVRRKLGDRSRAISPEAIFSGASAMAFTLEASEVERQQILCEIRDVLAQTGADIKAVRDGREPPLAHLSFVCALEPMTEDHEKGHALARAEARNRAAQFRQLTTVLPPWPDSAPSVEKPMDLIDRLNRVLPADTPTWMPADPIPVTPTDDDLDQAQTTDGGTETKLSASVAARLSYGRRMRQEFYRTELKNSDSLLRNDTSFFRTLRFTDSLNDLCANPPMDVPENIRNKIAIFYADGNKFGAIRQKMSESESADYAKAWHHFSETLRGLQADLLGSLLERLKNVQEDSDQPRRRAWVWSDGKENRRALRFETLLWGGDEMMWVVPAWLAFWLAEGFFRLTQRWKITFEGHDYPLTYGVGMVICDRKTPIRQAKALAHELADGAKTLLGENDKPIGTIQFDIFESADLPDDRLMAHRHALFPGLEKTKLGATAFTLKGDRLADFIDWIEERKADGELPRSKIYEMLDRAVHETSFGDPEEGSALQKALEDYLKTMGRSPTLATDLGQAWGDSGLEKEKAQALFPLRLAQTTQAWDYVSPFNAPDLPLARFK